jgi:hypothetical protein
VTRFSILFGLIVLAINVCATSAQQRIFELRGLRMGIAPSELVDAVVSNGWSIPSYTDVTGRAHIQRLDYRDVPPLDSLTDEVLIQTEGLALDCTDSVATCAEVTSIKASFAYGSLVALELESGRGQEKVFRAFAIAGLRHLKTFYDATDISEGTIDSFFTSYSINSTKLMAEVDVLRWSGEGESSNGTAMPFSARIYAMRTTEKYDYHRPQKGIFLPWGVSRIVITQAPTGLLDAWAAAKEGLRASR